MEHQPKNKLSYLLSKQLLLELTYQHRRQLAQLNEVKISKILKINIPKNVKK